MVSETGMSVSESCPIRSNRKLQLQAIVNKARTERRKSCVSWKSSSPKGQANTRDVVGVSGLVEK